MTDNYELIKAALEVAKRFPVFPTTAKKMPCWSNKELDLPKGEGGFKIATQDPDRVRELFEHRNAETVSVPCGPMSGIVVIDPDLYKGQHVVDWHSENLHWLEKTLCHTTKRGGRHYIFKWTDKVRFPATLADGVDVKGHGGYVVWPGSDGYTVYKDLSVKPFPLDVLQAAMIAKGGSGNVLQMSSFNSATDEELIEQIKNATELYPALRSLSYRMPSRRNDDGTYLTETEMVNILENVMDLSVAATPSHPRHDDWVDRRGKIPELVSTAIQKEKRGVDLSPSELAAMQQGESFIKTEEMIVKSSRPIGPQWETTISDIEERVAEIKDDNDEYTIVDIQSLHANTISPVEWIIPGVIPKRNSIGLTGSSNVGKTRWLASLAVCIAAGKTEIIGLPKMEQPFPVLWIANEEYVDDIMRRMKAAARNYGIEDSLPIIVRGKENGAFKLARLNNSRVLEIDKDGVAKLISAIRNSNAGLVLMDPYVTLVDALDGSENSSAAAEVTRSALIMIQTRTDVSTLFAHHTPKGDRNAKGDWYRGSLEALRGSGAIGGALDCCFTLANWWPVGQSPRRSWQDSYLRKNLRRWIVLDSSKVREGDAISPIVMELVGQEMSEGEGRDIGVCKVSSEDEAVASNSFEKDKEAHFLLIVDSLIDAFGVGEVNGVKAIHEQMEDVPGWPPYKKTVQGTMLELFEKFDPAIRRGDYEVHVFQTGKGRGVRWKLSIVKTDDEDI